jgi:hypothetical protein
MTIANKGTGSVFLHALAQPRSVACRIRGVSEVVVFPTCDEEFHMPVEVT